MYNQGYLSKSKYANMKENISDCIFLVGICELFALKLLREKAVGKDCLSVELDVWIMQIDWSKWKQNSTLFQSESVYN